jgi:hypothetical protein
VKQSHEAAKAHELHPMLIEHALQRPFKGVAISSVRAMVDHRRRNAHRFARAEPAASGLFDRTSAISAGYEGPFAASIRAAMLEPRPEMRTATRFLAMRHQARSRCPR